MTKHPFDTARADEILAAGADGCWPEQVHKKGAGRRYGELATLERAGLCIRAISPARPRGGQCFRFPQNDAELLAAAVAASSAGNLARLATLAAGCGLNIDGLAERAAESIAASERAGQERRAAEAAQAEQERQDRAARLAALVDKLRSYSTAIHYPELGRRVEIETGADPAGGYAKISKALPYVGTVSTTIHGYEDEDGTFARLASEAARKMVDSWNINSGRDSTELRIKSAAMSAGREAAENYFRELLYVPPAR